MIKRIYIDNFKCFVNFEFKPDSTQLIFGPNGGGKSALFDVLERLKSYVVFGSKAEKVFPAATLTAWQTLPAQLYELEIEGNGGRYGYRLVLEHIAPEQKSRAVKEELTFDGKPLFVFDGHDVDLFRDDFSPGPVFPADWSR
jgi:predicted ATPase